MARKTKDLSAGFRPRFGRYPAPLALVAWVAFLGAPSRMYPSGWLQDGREPPLHPTVIIANIKGRQYPVTAASAEFAEITVEGRRERLFSDQSYSTPRAAGFAPGFIQFKAQNASSTIRTMTDRFRNYGDASDVDVPAGIMSESGNYACTIVSSGEIADCYIAVIFYLVNGTGDLVPGSTAIAFRQVGDLAAGRETRVTIDCGYVVRAGRGRGHYFPLAFSRGREIRTDQCENSARFLRHGEMETHAALLAQYRKDNPASDRPASAYLRFQPELPVGVDPRSLPSTVTANFSVTETGEVDDVELDQVLDAKVEKEIRRALDGWLFLPRLRKGLPVRSRITVPLSFEGASY